MQCNIGERMSLRQSLWIGWDPKEADAFAVARHSARRHMSHQIPTRSVNLLTLQASGMYRRPIAYKASAADRPVMWDVVSDAPMSTEHANARFFVPMLADTGWAVFTDGDVLFRANIIRLFDQLDQSKAVFCVKHNLQPKFGRAFPEKKMDGQIQTSYSRKNWSSVMAINCRHPKNKILFDLNFLNETPGRDLHRFCWLDDSEIGELDQSWNYLVGVNEYMPDPKIVHFTEGTPSMPGYHGCEYAKDWRAELAMWSS